MIKIAIQISGTRKVYAGRCDCNTALKGVVIISEERAVIIEICVWCASLICLAVYDAYVRPSSDGPVCKMRKYVNDIV